MAGRVDSLDWVPIPKSRAVGLVPTKLPGEMEICCVCKHVSALIGLAHGSGTTIIFEGRMG